MGHQAYTHKLLTGRKEDFSGLRTFGGMSGFPKHKESPCDAFDTGHSSTSISAALGYARARDLKGEDRTVVAVIGDGSLTGGMAYEASARFVDDIYDRYIAVSKIARDTAYGYFPTNNIEYIYNPFTYNKKKIKPHMRLISAIRNAPEKGMDRIKKAASILDKEKIPYTWSVFTDIVEANQGGLIFINCVTNVIDYISDSDYLVQFSRTEALSYSLTEALCSKTKIITTDIPAIHELNVVDKENGIVIPLEYFNEGNEELLKNKLLEAYNLKDKKIDYEYSKNRFIDYNTVFFK